VVNNNDGGQMMALIVERRSFDAMMFHDGEKGKKKSGNEEFFDLRANGTLLLS
jgi:hypothetical protein